MSLFLLGAMVATIAYIAGDMTLTAESQEKAKVFRGDVLIEGTLLVGEGVIIGRREDNTPYIILTTGVGDYKKTSAITLSGGQERNSRNSIRFVAGDDEEGISVIVLEKSGKEKRIQVD